MDEMNTTVVATLDSIGGELYEATVCTKDAYENRYDDVVKLWKSFIKPVTLWPPMRI